MPEGRERSGVWERILKALSILVIVGAVLFILVKIGLKPGDIALSVIALSATTVSACSLWLTRRHARMSVVPHLEFEWEQLENLPLSGILKLTNNGIGPGLVTEIKVAINDGPLTVLTDATAKQIWRDLGCEQAKSELPMEDGTSILPGMELQLLTGLPPFTENSELKRLHATANFTSIYHDKALKTSFMHEQED